MKLTLAVTFILTLFISSGSALGCCTGKGGYDCACKQCEKTYTTKTQYSCSTQCKVCKECSMRGMQCDCCKKKKHNCNTDRYCATGYKRTTVQHSLVQCSLCGESYTQGHQHHCNAHCKSCGVTHRRGTEHRCGTIQCGICGTHYMKGTRHECGHRHHYKQCNPYKQCDTRHTRKISSCSVKCKTCGVTYTEGTRHECRPYL